MKKFFKGLLLSLILCVGVISLTGCGKGKSKNDSVSESKFDMSKYTKDVEIYNLQATNKKASISVGFAKDAGYSRKDANAIYRLVLENSYNKVEVQFFNTKLETSQAVYKRKKEDFDENKITDFSKLSINGNEGWEVYRVNSATKKIMSYEAQLFLGENDGLTSVAKILVNPNFTTEEGKNFDFKAFVQSDDFQYLLHSIKIK